MAADTNSGFAMLSVLAALSGIGVAACLVILMLPPTVTVVGYEVLGYRHELEAPLRLSWYVIVAASMPRL
jgi:hypothetical protein